MKGYVHTTALVDRGVYGIVRVPRLYFAIGTVRFLHRKRKEKAGCICGEPARTIRQTVTMCNKMRSHTSEMRSTRGGEKIRKEKIRWLEGGPMVKTRRAQTDHGIRGEVSVHV